MATVPTEDQIDSILNHDKTTSSPRDYLGLSQIGNSCHRYLQHYHYWTFDNEISARVQRLFNFGHMMEEHMIADLASLEIFVKEQQSEVIGAAGHWKGHSDGVAISAADIDQEFLLEFKTHNDKSFKMLKKDGLKSKPAHYDQMQSYMGYQKLPFCFYIAYNKNDSEYWYKIVQFDEERFRELKRKEFEIITADVLLPRIGNGSPSWFECKFCDARDVCFERKPVVKTCRSCKHVDVLDEGKWKCTHHEIILTPDEQRVGCTDYELGDMFK